MSLFGKKAPSPAGAPAPRSVFGTIGSLFNPHIGATLRPLGETGKMLTSIIALLFVANGLFPRNHPALLPNSTVQLTFPEVIRIGWSNVRIARDTIPQTLIFFAVILSLGCSILAILVGFMTLLMGTAHAQNLPAMGPAMFQPPAQDNNDVACGWINWLFNTTTFNCDLQNYLQPNGQQVSNMQSTSIQTALIATLGFYSDVILVIAAVVLFYHLTAMIVETAHHGVIMGRRANQVWAPIRLVVAVGLLVPIASGLNSGQFIVLQIAQWGGAVASNAWANFLDALDADQFNQLVPPIAPIVRQQVADIVLMGACAQAYNNIVCPPTNNNQCTASAIQIPPQGVPQPDQSTKYSFMPPANGQVGVEADYKDICGYYSENPQIFGNGPDQQLAQQIRQAGETAFNATVGNILQFGETNVLHFLEPKYGGSYDQNIPVNNGFEQLISQLYGNLQGALANVGAYLQMEMDAVAQIARAQGWVAAGAWFNTVARIQGDVTDLAHDFPFKTEQPQVMTIFNSEKTENPKYSDLTVPGKLNRVMDRFAHWLSQEQNQANPVGNGLSPEQQQIQFAEAGIIAGGGNQKTHMMDLIFQAVDYIASRDGVWQPSTTACAGQGTNNCFSLGVQFTGANPLAEIAAFGHSNLNTAYDVFDDYLLFTSLMSIGKDVSIAAQGLDTRGSSRFGGVISMFARMFAATAGAGAEAGNSIGDVIGMIVVVFFTGGFMLAFFLPLIPFYRFMFGTLSWFLSLLEAIIAVPLVALAHLTPEGEGFMGDKAKTAYYFVFNLFLRPVLMVFGLICGYLLFCIAASLMNLLYTTAVASAGGVSNGHLTLARIVYSIIYIVILYLSCNKCFQLIDWLPEHAIKWMGAQGLHHAPMGDPMEVGGYMGLASGYVEQKIVSGAGAVAKNPIGGAITAAEMNRQGMAEGGLREIGKVSKEAESGARSVLGHATKAEEAFLGSGKQDMAAANKALNAEGLKGFTKRQVEDNEQAQ